MVWIFLLVLFLVEATVRVESSCHFDVSKIVNPTIVEDVRENDNVIIHCCSGANWKFTSDNSQEPFIITEFKDSDKNRYVIKDNGNLTLFIKQMKIEFMGNYVCSSTDDLNSGTLNLKMVHSSTHDYIVRHYRLLDINEPKILICPKEDDEEVILWKWLALNENQTDFMVIARQDGEFRHLNIIDNLSKAVIKDAKSLEASREVWCQVKTKSNKVKYNELRWQLYKPIRGTIEALEQNHQLPMAKFDRQANRVLSYLREKRANRLLCIIGDTEGHNDVSIHWKINGKNVLTPPFEINNDNLSNLSFSSLYTSNYPKRIKDNGHDFDDITCIIQSTVKFNSKDSTKEQHLTNTISKKFEVIRIPEIQNFSSTKEIYSQQDTAVLTCSFSANGKIQSKLEFSSQLPDRDSLTKWTQMNDVSREDDKISLKINTVDRKNHGNYRCIIENRSGRIQRVFSLKVRTEPMVKLQTSLDNGYYYQSRGPFIAECNINGYPLQLDKEALYLRIKCPKKNIDRTSIEGRDKITLLTQISDEILGIRANYSVVTVDLSFDCEVSCEYKTADGGIHKDSRVFLEAKAPKQTQYLKHVCSSFNGMVFKFNEEQIPKAIDPINNITAISVNYQCSNQSNDSWNLYTKIDLRNLVPISILSMVKPNTQYNIEWNFENQLGLKSIQKMTLSTKGESAPPPPKKISLVKTDPIENVSVFSVDIEDPCPYKGGREELGDFIIRFLDTGLVMNTNQGVYQPSAMACTIPEKSDPTDWSGNESIQCSVNILHLPNLSKIEVASRNRFGVSAARILKLDTAIVQQLKGTEGTNSKSGSHHSDSIIIKTISLTTIVMFLLATTSSV